MLTNLLILCCGMQLHTTDIVDAIYKLEGGTKTAYPYGIKSVTTSNPRLVCANTVNNNHKRWQHSKDKGCYLIFLADRYCPASVDPTGNKNWKHNITMILNHRIARKDSGRHNEMLKPRNALAVSR